MLTEGENERVALSGRIWTLITHPHQAMEIVRFGSVGLFNNLVYFGLYSGLIAAGTPYWGASLVGYGVSALIGYWLHEHFSFGGAKPTFRALGKWLLAQATALLLNLGLLTVLIHKAHFKEIPAQLVLLPVIPVISYLISRYWIFTRADPAAAATPPGR